ncbi:MAG: histidine kinase [Gemmatimonadaceae bacterium]
MVAGRDTGPVWRSRTGVAALLSGAMVLGAGIEALSEYAVRGHTLGYEFLLMLPPWVLRAVFAPIPIGLARRLVHRRLAVIVAVHAAGAVVYAVLHLSSLAALHTWVYHVPYPFTEQFGDLFNEYALRVGETYLAFAAVSHALTYERLLGEREANAVALQGELAQAQLRGLRNQLHPHFLFNALNTVAMMAREGNSAAVVSMISRLSALLRYALRASIDAEVAFDAELAFTREYLAIEVERHAPRFSVTWRIAPEASTLRVPALVLQPLTENVVRHAVAAVRRPVAMGIEAVVAAGELRLTVWDDGPGLMRPSAGPGAGIGTSNIRERLRRMYGEAGALEVAARPEGGVIATVRVPARSAGSVAA